MLKKNEIITHLCTQFSKSAELPLGSIDPSKALATYGLDSIVAHDLIAEIKEKYGIDFKIGLLDEHPTIEAISSYIYSKLETR